MLAIMYLVIIMCIAFAFLWSVEVNQSARAEVERVRKECDEHVKAYKAIIEQQDQVAREMIDFVHHTPWPEMVQRQEVELDRFEIMQRAPEVYTCERPEIMAEPKLCELREYRLGMALMTMRDGGRTEFGRAALMLAGAKLYRDAVILDARDRSRESGQDHG